MVHKSIVWIATPIAVLMATMAIAGAPAKSPGTPNRLAMDATNASGMRTDRLSPRQLKVWKSLTTIVLASDQAGNPVHPKLYSLWQAVAANGRVVYIELPDPNFGKNNVNAEAGVVIVEDIDPGGCVSAAAIRLCRWTIDHAKSDPSDDGFEPLQGLGKMERYVEVLGHELAHAAMALRDPAYAWTLHELKREAADLCILCRTRLESPQSMEEFQHLSDRIKILTEKVEGPARAAEMEVRRELLQNRRGK